MMTRPLDLSTLQTRHDSMLAFQKKITPFVLTKRDYKAIWFIENPYDVLAHFLRLGWVIQRGRQYYAIERKK